MSRRVVLDGVSPAVLAWARVQAGYSIAEIAGKLKLDPAQLESWESGEDAPSYPQLEKLASRYRRPVAVFFFPAPPEEPSARESFRALPDFVFGELDSDALYAVRRGYSLQLALAELTGGENPVESKITDEFRASLESNPVALAIDVRNNLGVDVEQQARWANADEGLKTWRAAVESRGVFVFKRPFKLKREISGFCLVDDEFPLIMISNSGPKSRQTFTLFHELGHLLLGMNDLFVEWHQDPDHAILGDPETELFCNEFASEVLVPSTYLAREVERVGASTEAVQQIARRYSVSREVVVRRLHKIGVLADEDYRSRLRELYREYEEFWQRDGNSEGSGGDFYANQVQYFGESFISLAVTALHQGRVTIAQLSDYFGFKSDTVAKLEDYWLSRVSS